MKIQPKEQKPYILTYEKIHDISTAGQSNHINKDGVIVTASAKMAENLRNFSPQIDSKQILEMNILLRRLLPDWYDEEQAVENFIELGDIIRSQKSLFSAEEKRILSKNRSDMLKSIRALLEMGILPDSLPDTTKSIRLFQSIYEAFCKNSRAAISLITRTEKWKNPAAFKRMLSQVPITRNPKKTSRQFDEVSVIYFQGFYYITPLQARLIQAFEQAGVQVVFLNHEDLQAPEAFQIFQQNSHFQGLSRRKIESSGRWTPRFASIFSQADTCEKVTGISMRSFPDVFSFVTFLDAKRQENGMAKPKEHIFSTNGKDLQDFFSVFFPEQETKRHLLAYPVGQYIFQLYKMWDSETGQVFFPVDAVRNCLASGWAGRHASDQKKNLESFNRAAAYFADCQTLKDWNMRLQLIEDLQREILPLFSGASGERWHKMVASPLHFIDALHLTADEIRILREELEDIFKDAQMLFSSEDVDLKNHFRQLEHLIREKNAYEILSADERKAVDLILAKLDRIPRGKSSCHAEDLAEAMSFYLGGELSTEDDFEGRGIADIESEFLYEEKSPVMVCFCDDQHMPGAPKNYPWPLSKNLLLALVLSPMESSLRQDYLYYMESTRLENRYLFYLSLQLPQVEYSWVADYGGQKLVMASYLKLLQAACESSMEVQKKDPIAQPRAGADIVPLKLPEKKRAQNFVPADFADRKLLELVYNQKYCPWRSLYDFGLQDANGFQTRFQLGFYATMLLRFLKTSVGQVFSLEQAAAHLFHVMPFWNEAEQKQIIFFARGGTKNLKNIKDYEENLDGNSYLPNRLYLKYPYNPIMKELIEQKKPADEPKQKRCRFCPHQAVCYYRSFGEDESHHEK